MAFENNMKVATVDVERRETKALLDGHYFRSPTLN